MVFKRRNKAPFWSRMREILAPKKGWRRGYIYVGKRMQRLPDSPHRIALGFACGAMASFTPFFGFHFVLAAALAWVFRGNLLASALGTFVGNPLTFPFIAATSFYLGSAITGIHVKIDGQAMHFSWIWQHFDEIFVPYLVGGLLPGLATAVISYYLVRPLVAAYQGRRRKRLMARAKQRMLDHRGRRAHGMGPLEADGAG